jgi:hypothetical protein
LFTESNQYLGLFIYIVVPAFLVFGLLLIPIGMIRKIRKDKHKQVKEKKGWWPAIDLNDQRHRNAAILFLITTVVFVLGSAVGSMEAFHYTESVKFCGTLCHNVMEPEYVAYQNSPHARVKCVECHVGAGASWYVKSKLSGLYQVYAVLTGKYPTPIPTPISNLRPARETCEKCHWPQKFYSRKLVTKRSFLADTNNTEWDIALQMKIGPNFSALGLQEGIHWHINQDVKIEYIPSTLNRETIPWVKLTNLKTGKVHIYQDEENALSKEAMDTLPLRTMDCMDCHTRPSHMYKSPQKFVDEALINGKIPKELPFIKFASMKFLKENYSNKDTALITIADSIRNFYKANYPEIFNTKNEMITKAIAGITDGFSKNIFPFMKVRWDAYPDHIGHQESDGCFRCHSDKHKNQEGKIISKDCNLCHTIIAQGRPNSIQTASIFDTMEFRHPIDIGTDWKEYFCTECHKSLY